MRIGLIGSGHIGSTLARLAIDSGHDVVVSNSRGATTLDELVHALGEGATSGTAAEAAAAGSIVVVAIPIKSYRDVPVDELAGKVVLDTGNYYPARDGHIPELDSGQITSSELLARQLPTSHLVKAFNTVYYEDLATRGEPAGTAGRRALPLSGDDEGAKAAAGDLIGSFGFDVVDAGPLAEGRRFQPGTPAYGTLLSAEELRDALARGGG